jgi:hypothetical protein
MIFGVEHLRQFTQRHGVTHGHGEIADKRQLAAIEHRPFDDFSAERVGPVQKEVRDVLFRGGFHAVRHRGDEGVEAHPRVLNVEDEFGTDASMRPRMPCSGLNSATSLTPFACARRSIVRCPAESTPV